MIIDTHTSRAGGYPNPGNSFEQWVRTAKTFVIDYMEEMPCLRVNGGVVEGTVTTLTAKPFEDYKNFAIGALIQDPTTLIRPNDDAIKAAYAGRTRCPYTFFEGFTDPLTACPPLNGDGGPPYPTKVSISRNCRFDSASRHLPDEWANGTYVPPYDLAERAPDIGIFDWDIYGPVACTAVCPFLQSFCDLKGIVCNERRLKEEAEIMKEPLMHRRLNEARADADHKERLDNIMWELEHDPQS